MPALQAIIGLGNPGPQYAATRHNAGALWVQHLAERHFASLRPEKRFHGLYGKMRIQGQDIHLLFPQTFMNRSGLAVQALANYYRLPAEAILVAHDELDIAPGEVRLKRGGGHGGHNGLRDIIKALGNQKDFARLRLGIGHPGDKNRVADYVLHAFSKTEWSHLQHVFDTLDPLLEAILKDDWARPMNILHSLRP
ncbi:MAG: aminoacyl-tRNA hydrolase [Gammaproteobacteria bacterium]|nr:MAG: aminoacyl-tRNA hydrolase [Gammaproteobacteria bacterium]